jgi:hypothetical protein
MKTAMISVVALMLMASAGRGQSGCQAQLKPLKPLTPLGCADTVAACLCADNFNCRWTYVCSGESGSRVKPQGDLWRIPLQNQPQSAAEQAFKGQESALKARDMMLQIELRRQQVEALRLENEARARALAEPPAPQPPSTAPDPVFTGGPDNPEKTYGLYNGRWWVSSEDYLKLGWMIGARELSVRFAHEFGVNSVYAANPGLTIGELCTALDRFYAEPENAVITVASGLRIAMMKATGKPQSEVDAELSLARRTANGAPERSKK